MRCKTQGCRRTAVKNWAYCAFHIQEWLDRNHR